MASSLKPHHNKVAYQHNNFVRAATKMGVIEHRIFMQALSDLTLSDKAFPLTEMTAKEVMRGLSNGESYQDVHQAVNTLVERVINLVPVHERGTRTVRVPLTARVEFDTAEGIVRVKLNEEAGPYLLNLAAIGNYTSLDVQTALDLRNPNAIKMYSILRSWRNLNTGDKDFAVYKESLENLKHWLLENSELYPIFGDFKRRVLEPVFADFARIGYGATCKPFKTGKKTTHVTFSIPKDKKVSKGESIATHSVTSTASPDPGATGEPAPVMKVVRTAPVVEAPMVAAPVAQGMKSKVTVRLTKLKLTKSQIKTVLEVVQGEQELTKLYKDIYPLHRSLLDATIADHNDANIGGKAVAWLKSNYPRLYPMTDK